MKYEDFTKSLSTVCPEGISPELKSLWLEKSGDWDAAHTLIQGIPSDTGSAVHAYLHRREGDIGNARYWYNRANRTKYAGGLDDEWEALAKEFCD